MGFNTIVYEKGDGIALVTLNRPKSLNALCDELIGELGMVFHEIDEDPDTSVVIITGGDKVFAAGADIKELSQIATPLIAQQVCIRVQCGLQPNRRLFQTGNCRCRRVCSRGRMRVGPCLRFQDCRRQCVVRSA